MFKAVLFDLDGTLLPLDMNVFMAEYFKKLTGDFIDHYHPKEFESYIWEATKAMVKDNRPDKTNQEVFMQTFFPLVKHTEEELMPIFDAFYTVKFNELKQFTSPNPLAKKIVETLAAKGYRLVLATNPIFPHAATNTRMRWAEIADLPWELVTTYENSHFCKPNPAYFAEILRQLNLKPNEVLVIGNDTLEDLAAGKLGIKTYLVTDCLIDRGNSPFKPDAVGTMAELYQAVQNDFKGVFA